MKKYSYWQLEGVLLKVFEDAQNGVETVLGRQVMGSMDVHANDAQRLDALPSDAKHVAKRDCL